MRTECNSKKSNRYGRIKDVEHEGFNGEKD
jgi:hypothetical protein